MDMDTPDILIVGYGGAGSAAALRAAQLGATVLVVEKQPENAHTPSTRMSGGHIMGVNDADAATRYLHRCAGGMIPLEVSRAWAERSRNLVDWLDELGTDLQLSRGYGAEHPEFEGAEAIDVYVQSRYADGSAADDLLSKGSGVAQGAVLASAPNMRAGRELFRAMSDAVERQALIRIMWGSPGRRLVRTEAGRVTGLEVMTAGGPRVVRARAGVVLACGGYEFDTTLKLHYLKAPDIHFYGNPGNTGDGVRMAQAIGADLWHMNQMVGRAIGHFSLGGRDLNVAILVASPGGYVITDARGKRFMNETRQATGMHDVYNDLIAFDPARAEYPRIPCYLFFDQKRMESPLIAPHIGAVGVGMYEWSEDNKAEVERGWIKVGDTIEEVSAAAGMLDPSAAAESVRRYNAGCESGQDDWGRSGDDLIPLVGPPFYCLPLYPGGPNTTGGPRRSPRAEILDPFGDPIPGLYGAGELGSAIGMLYPAGGCNISDAFCFGQIAAEALLA